MTIEQVTYCTGCALCVDVCPHKAISWSEDKNDYYSPIVDHEVCVDCGLCLDTCIAEHEKEVARHELKNEKPYAAWTEDEDLIKDSASGGVFAQLAESFLQQANSVVYGATLTEDSRVKHICITCAKDIIKLQNSKYQQSDMTGIYADVRKQLTAGKRVLFSGCPCHIAAVYAFCGQHENLYTAEILCHGVPSNYLAQLAIQLEGAKRISKYRTKSLGWARGNRTVYESKEGRIYEKGRYRNDFHFRAYLSFSLIRESCKHCPFAQAHRVADVTMGDFWGLDKCKYNHPSGVSVLLVNSKKGDILTSTNKLYRKPTTWAEITRLNQNIYMPTNGIMRNLTDKVHEIKRKPLWLQKIILQNGFTNKWFNFAYEKCYAILTKHKHLKAVKEQKENRAKLLEEVSETRPKVGILTTYFAANFGAMLQPYGLKRVLENEGCDVEFVRYKQKNVYEGHLPISLERIKQSGFKGAIGVIVALPFAIIQYRRLQNFRKKYLQRDSSFSDIIPQEKDYYFFGSDQIWNPRNTGGFDKIYFGDFPVKKFAKKIAYAASGERIEYTPENCNFIKQNIRNFDAVSVREESLKNQFEQYLGIKDVEVVLDPTLLATRDILDELPGTNPLPDEPFVLFYQLRKSIAFLPKIYEFARSKGMKLVIVSSTPKKDLLSFALKHKDVIYKPSAGMDIFLGGERNAKYVFTPSFHGCVFATIYHKPLFALQLNDGLDTRAHDLLKSLGMENRCVSIEDDFNNIAETDYNRVEQKLCALREKSLNFIRKNMQS